MTSFQPTFKAHFAAARTQVAQEFAAADAQAQQRVADFEKVAGPIKGRLSAKAVEDAFQKAFDGGASKNELLSILSGLVRGSIDFKEIVGPVNSKAKLMTILSQARAEIGEVRKGLESPAALREVLSVIPNEMKAGRSQADITLIASEVRAYAVAIVDEVARRVEAAAAKSDTPRDRAVGLTTVKEVADLFRAFRSEQKAFEPLKTFDFAAAGEMSAKARKAYPTLAAAFDAASSKDLPAEIIIRIPLGVSIEADKHDAGALNQAAWATFQTQSASADQVKQALRISLYSVRLTHAKDATHLDTAACLAARLGQAELARECNAASKTISPERAKDSTAYLAAIASGAEKPFPTASEIAKRYAALVAACEKATFEAPTEPVMLPGVLGMKYRADFTNVEHLNRIAWGAYEANDSVISKRELIELRDVAAVGCRLSQYSDAAILDTFACLAHRTGALEVGREAAKRAAEIDPELAKASAKLYA